MKTLCRRHNDLIEKLEHKIHPQKLHSLFLAGFTIIGILVFLYFTIYKPEYIFSIHSRELECPLFVFDEFNKGKPFWMLGDIPARLRLIVGYFIMLGTGVIAVVGFFWLLIERLNFLCALIIFFISAGVACHRVSGPEIKFELSKFFVESIITKAENKGRIDPGIMGYSNCEIRSFHESNDDVIKKYIPDFKAKKNECTALIFHSTVVVYNNEGKKIDLAVYDSSQMEKAFTSMPTDIESVKSELVGKNITYSTTEKLTKPYRINQYINFTAIYMMIVTFISLCLRNGGEKWHDPNSLLQRKRMIFGAIIIGIILLSMSSIRNETFYSWPATLLAAEQQTEALKIVHSFVLVIGTYFTMMLIILTIPALFALELDIQCAAKLNFDYENSSQDINFNAIEKWRNSNGLTLSGKSVIASSLGALAPMLAAPFGNFIS